jgi:hypothetical protein
MFNPFEFMNILKILRLDNLHFNHVDIKKYKFLFIWNKISLNIQIADNISFNLTTYRLL